MRNIILLGIVFFAFAKINAQQLASYIQEAQDNNPEIQAFEARFANAINSLKALFETLGNRDEYRYDNIRGIQG